MERNSAPYTLVFTLIVCAVCSVLVAGAYVLLGERQRSDAAVSRMLDILRLTGLAEAGEELERDEIFARFEAIRPRAIDTETWQVDPDVDARLFDQREAENDPLTSREAPPNSAGVRRLPSHVVVYEKLGDDGQLEQILLPIHGQGYGGQIYGFLSLGPDLNTIRDIVFYEHQETPTLGGRIDRPKWRSAWPGRRVFDADGSVVLRLVADPGPPEIDPHRVDLVSRASVTTAGIQNMIEFWMGPAGFASFLDDYRDTSASGDATVQRSQE